LVPFFFGKERNVKNNPFCRNKPSVDKANTKNEPSRTNKPSVDKPNQKGTPK
jgi:hypothetical protein